VLHAALPDLDRILVALLKTAQGAAQLGLLSCCSALLAFASDSGSDEWPQWFGAPAPGQTPTAVAKETKELCLALKAAVASPSEAVSVGNVLGFVL
jgi:hypothetical protein